MRSGDRPRGLVTRAGTQAASLALLVLGMSCGDGFQPISSAAAPTAVAAAAVRMDAVRLTWTPVAAANVASYVVTRRRAFTGAFVEVAQVPQTNLAQAIWIDADVEPETFYGYRVMAVTNVGDRSAPSTIGGALTPPPPGIDIATTSLVTAASALDPDGYEVLIAGPDTVRAPVGVEARRRFSPLRPGRYTVTLVGVISRCSVSGEATRTVDVTDTTAHTIVDVAFELVCRDPSRGDIAVSLQASGQEIDPEVLIDVLGEAADATLPANERVYAAQRVVSIAQPTTTFGNLRPGVYDVTIEEVAGNCVLTGTPTRTVTVTALGVAAVNFAITCTGGDVVVSDAPFVWRNRWSPATAVNGGSVVLRSELDLSARAGKGVKGVQADVYYDPAVLEYVQEIATQLPILTVNANTPGRISFIASTTTAARTGVVQLAEFEFRVIGSPGTMSTTTTQNLKAGDPAAFQDSVRVEEDTFTVATGGALNTAPIAEANGPYAGVAGSPMTLSALGSFDADGGILTYSWSFGDGTSGTGASTTTTYANAGTYTVTLTVTDDDGATDADQATVTIAPAGTANTPPVAEANGPYAATAGVTLTLSSVGSTDPGGAIVSYQWTLGNGQFATGASPSVTYATAGTYTLTLTVTDNLGATDTDQATVTVTAVQSAQPLMWRNEFGPVDVVNNRVAITIGYDLRTNIADTPGAEALQSFGVDSLKWDPSVLQFHSISLGPNVTGTSNQNGVTSGRLRFSGAFGGGQQQGLITIATIRFTLVGASGASTTTATHLGALLGAVSTNFFVYNSRTTVVEGAFAVP